MKTKKDRTKELGLAMKELRRRITIKKITIFNFISMLREIQAMFVVVLDFIHHVSINGMSNSEGQLSMAQVLLSQTQQIKDLHTRIDKLEGDKFDGRR